MYKLQPEYYLSVLASDGNNHRCLVLISVIELVDEGILLHHIKNSVLFEFRQTARRLHRIDIPFYSCP